MKANQMEQESKKAKRTYHTNPKFPGRGGKDWAGPIVDYKELDLLRKHMTGSSKIMSRKRNSATAQEQRALMMAVKRARFMALIPYSGF